jgi:hypothetical protein
MNLQSVPLLLHCHPLQPSACAWHVPATRRHAPLVAATYDIGGYQLPFLLGAGLAFIDVLVVVLLMDDAAAVASPAPVPDDKTEFSPINNLVYIPQLANSTTCPLHS